MLRNRRLRLLVLLPLAPGVIASAAAAGPVARAALHAQVAREGTVRVLATLAVPAASSADAGVPDRPATLAVVREALVAELGDAGVVPVRRFDALPYVALEVDAGGLARLEASGLVSDVVADRLHAPAMEAGIVIVEGDRAHAAGRDGSGQTIAILDTGVDASHPAFGGRVRGEACFSAASGCPGGGSDEFGPGAARPCTYGPVCAHGTHVAGIAAGAGVGVAPGADVLAVQVFSPSEVCGYGEGNPCPRAWTSDLMAALEWVHARAAERPIAAVNMSLAGVVRRSQATCDRAEAGVKAAIDLLRDAGVATVIAAGNDAATDGLGAPGCVSSAVSVGATILDDPVAHFSNSAPFLKLLAPGVSIRSTVPGGGYGTASGTSQAAPHVSGAFAVLRQHAPEATVKELVDAVRSGGAPLIDARNGVVTPRLRIEAARAHLTPAVAAARVTEAEAACGCATAVDNFCLLGVDVAGCAMTAPGGYCDPDGDGDRADADWVRGWTEYQATCGAGAATE